MNQPQALLRLQTLETSLDDAKQRLDEIESALQNNELVQAAEATLESRTRDLQRMEGMVQDFELELAGLIEKLDTNESLLYSGKISSHREIQDRKNEVESLKRRRTKLESELASARESLREYRMVYEEAQVAYEQAKAASATQNQDLIAEREDLKRRMGKWLQDRKVTLEDVDPVAHKLYKHVKKQKHGTAVARLEEDACSVCRVEQNQTIVRQVRLGKEIVQCQNCGRILVEIGGLA
jgi:hypothetical protein